MSNEGQVSPVKIVRTSEGLRDQLFDTLEGLNAGTKTAQEAQAICKIAAQIINSVNTEIEFYKQIARHQQAGEPAVKTILQLGTRPEGAE